MDCAYSNTNVTLIGISGGISYGALGMSHHSAQDIAAMSAIPNMRVYLPSDRFQTAKLIEALLQDEKPSYIRVGRNAVEDIYTEDNCPFEMDRATVVYTVMGDGELAEGSVWEGVMAAHQYKLDNLCAVVDRNRLQISGNTEDVMSHDSQEERWSSFGWHVISIDGNNYQELKAAFEEAKTVKGSPTVIIANTVKGFGSPLMENKANWHHKVPNAEEYTQIMKDLETGKEAALHE